MAMRVLIQLPRRRQRERTAAYFDVPQFRLMPPPRRGFPRALGISISLHLLFAAAGPEFIEFISRNFDAQEALRAQRDDALLIRASDKHTLFLPVTKADKPLKNSGGSQPGSRGEGPKLSAPRPKAAPARKRPFFPTQREEQFLSVLIQPKGPQVPPASAMKLPPISVWTGPPKPALKPIVPGAVEPVPSKLTASLKPSPEIPLPAFPKTDTPAPKLPPARSRLTLPPSSSSPIKAATLEDVNIDPTSPVKGDPAALIAFSSALVKPGEDIRVPPGSHIVAGQSQPQTAEPQGPLTPGPSGTGRDAKEGGGSATGSGTGQGTAEGSGGSDKKEGGAGGTGASAGTGGGGSARGQGSGAGAGTGPGGAGGTGTGAGTGKGPGSGPGEIAGPGEVSLKTLPGGIKMQETADGTVLTYPALGNFDVVVVQSSVPDEAAEYTHLLTGRPVHTVFLNVGLKKEWILQYCEPGKSNPGTQSGMVVNLGAPAPLKAPYIQKVVLPRTEVWKGKRVQVFQGLLNPSGKFEKVKGVRVDPLGLALLYYLEQWNFRPATSQGQPKTVEVLLIVPSE